MNLPCVVAGEALENGDFDNDPECTSPFTDDETLDPRVADALFPGNSPKLLPWGDDRTAPLVTLEVGIGMGTGIGIGPTEELFFFADVESAAFAGSTLSIECPCAFPDPGTAPGPAPGPAPLPAPAAAPGFPFVKPCNAASSVDNSGSSSSSSVLFAVFRLPDFNLLQRN